MEDNKNQEAVQKWQKAQVIEADYWRVYAQHEIIKQDIYLKMLGINDISKWSKRRVLDIGGGPLSVCFRMTTDNTRVVVDPIAADVLDCAKKYKDSGIIFENYPAEEFNGTLKNANAQEPVNGTETFTDVMIYNCLQHTINPAEIIRRALNSLENNGTFYLCEQIGLPPGKVGTNYCDCHPHILEWKPLLQQVMRHPDIKLVKTELYKDYHPDVTGEWLTIVATKKVKTQPAISTKKDRLAERDKKIEESKKHQYTHGVYPHRKLRFHVLGIPHAKTHLDFVACAYSMKIYNFCRMMKDAGHEVIHYGTEGSNPPCTEHVTIVPQSLHDDFYGKNLEKYNWRERLFPGYNTEGKIFWDYAAMKTPAEVEKRVTGQHDILCVTFGWPQVAHFGNAPKKGAKIVETGIGYSGVCTNVWFRVFETYCWMAMVHGLMKFKAGRYYDAVIWNYYDPEMFQFYPKSKKEDYVLFCARNTWDKGLMTAVAATKYAGLKLKVAGQRCGPDGKIMVPQAYEQPHVEYIGYLGVKERNEVMGKARALFSATEYWEPFGGVAVEAMMCFPSETKIQAKGIERLYSRVYNGAILKIHTDNEVLECTPDHPFLTRRGWVPAKELTTEDDLVRRVGHDKSPSLDSERIGNIVARLSKSGACSGSEIIKSTDILCYTKNKKTKIAQKSQALVHSRRNKYYTRTLSEIGCRRSRENVGETSSKCAEKSQSSTSSISEKLDTLHGTRIANIERRICNAWSNRAWENNESFSDFDKIESRKIWSKMQHNQQNNFLASHDDTNRVSVLCGLNRRRGDGNSQKKSWRDKKGQNSTSGCSKYVRFCDRMDKEQNHNSEPDYLCKKSQRRNVKAREQTEDHEGIYKRFRLSAVIQSTSAILNNKKTTNGINYRVVRNQITTSKNQSRTIRKNEPVGADDSVYEYTRIRSIASREVKNLPVFNLGTRSGIYEANGIIVHNCGTPPVTTDWGCYAETVVHGQTGFRCRMLQDFVDALNRIDEIDNNACRAWAIGNASLAVAQEKYDDYFQRVARCRSDGEPNNLDWQIGGDFSLDPWMPNALKIG